ncbi:hypothetical protein D9C01_13375, partial [Corynebacterium diphtheriae]
HTAWQTLTDAVEAIPAGSWTSYGELARLIGSHPVPRGDLPRADGPCRTLIVCSRREAPSLRPSGGPHTAWQTLTDAVEAIPAGSWTSYGELARLIGSH